MSSSGVQHIYLRPTDDKPRTPAPARHTGILQDQLRRAQRRPWTPGFSLAVRILMLVRITGAMYSNIDDCDEVFNFWEPLHFLDQGSAFQTWETSPLYAIRSWAYIMLHLPPVRLAAALLGAEKRPAFFAVRMFLSALCVLAEVSFYRTVVVKINERVGRYLFFMLMFSAGMWNASAAFLPSSFAMYMTMFAFSFAIDRPSYINSRRTMMATLSFATGAIIGWPFALALAIPFVFEELFIFGADLVTPEVYQSWLFKRWTRLFVAGLCAALIIVPVIGFDSLAYGKFVIVPWNIVQYNIFGGAERGPDLYGTSPWNFYILNLVLNFNILVPLSLLSLPALFVTYFVDTKRLGIIKPSANESSPLTILAIRLLPFYLWLGILTSQAHKEERFMFPVYPLLCFNAAVALYLLRGWQEALFIKLTSSPYRASQSMLFSRFTLSVVAATSIISFSRIMALWNYYHAPMTAVWALETQEIPRILNTTGLLPTYLNVSEDERPRIDLSPIKHLDLQLCVGKEWHRFPGSYLVPNGISVEFIKSEFNGLLPGHFSSIPGNSTSQWWLRPGTSNVPKDQNDLNKEEPSHYVSVDSCDYLIDLDFPLHPVETPLEPRSFIDARRSRLLTRAFWVPGEAWQSNNEFGDYCLLRNKALVTKKETEIKARIGEVNFRDLTTTMPSNGSQHNAPLPLDLLALSDLSPPSPILSPSEVTSAWSWSDIQIELDLSIDGEDPPDLPRSTNAAGRGLCILPSLSISTVSSAGTFGPVCKRHRTGISSPMSPQNSVASSLSTLEDVHISHSVSSMDVSPSMPTSPLRSQRVLDPAPSHGTSGTASDEETTPTILASLSPSPDILSQMNHEDIPIDNENNIPTSLRMLSGISHMPPSYESLSLSPSDSCLMPSVRSNGRRVIDDALFGTDARRLALAATLATLEKKCHSEPSTPKLAALDSSHGLPVDLSAATVEILIDQEGFRGVLASFTYIGYSAQGSSIGSDGPSVAQFRPTRRQAFNFHYAALEPLPILRRITVNGEESRDYISRQASLGSNAFVVLMLPDAVTPTSRQKSEAHARHEKECHS
ncbi:hypothetical protein C0991_007096 [Blastosporella zonata]|nr:hypothetical protein C0991_007096 [Blastosporella zonata]